MVKTHDAAQPRQSHKCATVRLPRWTQAVPGGTLFFISLIVIILKNSQIKSGSTLSVLTALAAVDFGDVSFKVPISLFLFVRG